MKKNYQKSNNGRRFGYHPTNRDVLFLTIIDLWLLAGLAGAILRLPSNLINLSGVAAMLILIFSEYVSSSFREWLNRDPRGKNENDNL